MSAEYYRSKLRTSQAKMFYDQIIAQIEDGNTSGKFKLTGFKERGISSDAVNAMSAIKLDRPEFFFLGREIRAESIGTSVTLSIDVLYNKSQITRIKNLLDKCIDKLCKDTEGLNELEREKLIYKRVALMRKYEDKSLPEDHSIVGPVLSGTGVCEGYASLLTLALRRSGIRCIRVNGKGRGEGHCWNVVWCYGVPCHVDVTWESVLNGQVGYFYFNLNDDEISLDHITDKRVHPACNLVFDELRGVRGFDSGKEGMHYVMNELSDGKESARVEIQKTDDLELWIKRAIFFSPIGSYRYTIDHVHKRALVVKEKAKKGKRKEN